MTGNKTARRVFGSVGLSFILPFEKWQLSSRIGYQFAKEWQRKMTDSEGLEHDENQVSSGTGTIGVNIGYRFGKILPSLGLTYTKNFVQEEPQDVFGLASEQVVNDDDALQVSFGVSTAFDNGITAGLSAQTELYRENYENFFGSANLSIPF